MSLDRLGIWLCRLTLGALVVLLGAKAITVATLLGFPDETTYPGGLRRGALDREDPGGTASGHRHGSPNSRAMAIDRLVQPTLAAGHGVQVPSGSNSRA